MLQIVSYLPPCLYGKKILVPLGSPAQQVVADDHGRNPVEDLALGAAEGVENGVVAGASEGVLAVGGDAVVDNALLLLAT